MLWEFSFHYLIVVITVGSVPHPLLFIFTKSFFFSFSAFLFVYQVYITWSLALLWLQVRNVKSEADMMYSDANAYSGYPVDSTQMATNPTSASHEINSYWNSALPQHNPYAQLTLPTMSSRCASIFFLLFRESAGFPLDNYENFWAFQAKTLIITLGAAFDLELFYCSYNSGLLPMTSNTEEEYARSLSAVTSPAYAVPVSAANAPAGGEVVEIGKVVSSFCKTSY